MQAVNTLNNQQRAAVMATDGPVLIVAGPGTGKTKTLTARITYLISTGRVQPEQILALTFTKKTATEMQNRLGITKSVRQPKVTTFHALCYELLQLYSDGQITFVSELQRSAIIKSLPKPVALKHFSSRELGLLISRAKNAPNGPANELHSLLTAYNNALHKKDLHDFDDLLLKTHQLLKDNPSIRQLVQQRFRHILVDEFQDTNSLQYELLHVLRGHDNLFVIGDPLQSIYGFRGASSDIFERFKADFRRHTAFSLTVNYRSASVVVSLSNALFNGTLRAHTTAPGSVCAVQVFNEYSESQWVIDHVQQAIGGSDFLQAVSNDNAATHRRLSDFAIIYRSRSAAIAIQRAIEQSGLPYQVVGDGSPYEQPQVQALITLFKSYYSGEEAEVKGFSRVQCRSLLAEVPSAQLPQQLAQNIAEVFGLEPTTVLKQFFNSLVRFTTAKQAIQHLNTIAEYDFYDPAADAITLLTIHAAKGLEFSHVFLIAAQEGILPHAKAELAEERRLFYVAITRAKQQLDILYTTTRGGKPAQPSRFVTELPDTVLPKTTDPNLQSDRRRAQKRHAKRAQSSLF